MHKGLPVESKMNNSDQLTTYYCYIWRFTVLMVTKAEYGHRPWSLIGQCAVM